MQQWSESRRRVLVEKVSKRQILRETGMHWTTLEKILEHSQPPARLPVAKASAICLSRSRDPESHAGKSIRNQTWADWKTLLYWILSDVRKLLKLNSGNSPSITLSTSCTRQAQPACPNASCTVRAVPYCSF